VFQGVRSSPAGQVVPSVDGLIQLRVFEFPQAGTLAIALSGGLQ
jgi:hypothetical protein